MLFKVAHNLPKNTSWFISVNKSDVYRFLLRTFAPLEIPKAMKVIEFDRKIKKKVNEKTKTQKK